METDDKGKKRATSRIKLTVNRIAELAAPSGNQAVYVFDDDVKQLCIRVTPAGTKSYVFAGKLNSTPLRMTIGGVDVWLLGDARKEATRLQTLVDRGLDPRAEVAARKAQLEAAKREAAAKAAKVADAWHVYIEYQVSKMGLNHIERGKKWGPRHLLDHQRLAQAGGVAKQRGKGETKQGPLFPLLQMKIADISDKTLKTWLRSEAKDRANNARQAFEMFRAFWRWCATREEYKSVLDPDAVESKELRDEVPSRKSKVFDVMERGQLKSWFTAVKGLSNSVISAYLQALILTGARREEMAELRWDDVDFRWDTIWLKDKVVEEGRKVPLTPYLRSLLEQLPRKNQWVFSSSTAESGRITEPRIPHNRALALAGLPPLTLHGLRRTFASLSEWVEMPRGVIAQIMGHKPSATAEKHYINRPIELLAKWHSTYENWILEQAEIDFSANETNASLPQDGR